MPVFHFRGSRVSIKGKLWDWISLGNASCRKPRSRDRRLVQHQSDAMEPTTIEFGSSLSRYPPGKRHRQARTPASRRLMTLGIALRGDGRGP
jgi:hypothetical protein